MENEKKKVKLTRVIDMLDDACQVYAKNIKKFIEVYLRGLVGFIPVVAVMLLSGISVYLLPAMADALIFKIAIIVLLFLAILLAIYYGVRMRAAMILLIKNNYGSAKESFIESKKYFWGYVWVSILTAVIIGLWSILLIVPGIIFMVYYLLVNYTFFCEDLKGWAAMKRSKELVKGYWWAVFGRLAFIGLAAFIVNMVMAIPLGFTEPGSAAYVLYNIFMNLVWALIAPIIIIYAYYIYRDLVKIKK